MTDILKEIYYLVDESLDCGNSNGPAERKLCAPLTQEQRPMFEDFLSEIGDFGDRERFRLFYYALRLGITLALGDSRTL